MTVVFLHAFPLDERMWNGGAAPRLYGLGRTMDDWADAVLSKAELSRVTLTSTLREVLGRKSRARRSL